MLHPLNPPKCGRELGFIIGLQRRTLQYSCAYNAFNDSDYKKSVGIELVNWLNSRRSTGKKNDRYVMGFFQDISRLLRCDTAQKNQVLLDFLHDQSFYRFLGDPSFQFSFTPNKTAAHTIATKILIQFFDFLGFAGYPESVIAHVLGGKKRFSKNNVIEGYKLTNSGIQFVCPCCDNAFTDSGNGNDEGYTLEHYFPKSLYPSICLHPYNLIPMCSKCNKEKGNKDPLAPVDKTNAPHPVSYAEIFHPIKRPVRKYADLVISKSASGPETMRFISKNPAQSLLPAINAYEIMYDIPPRWKVLMTRVDKRVNDSINHNLRPLLRGRPIDPDLFNDAVSYAISELEEQCGSEYLSYPALRWLLWAKSNKLNDLYSSFANG